MAQVLLLKLDSVTGLPNEFNSTADDITLNSFSVQGGGPVLQTSGLDMNNTDIVDIQDLNFVSPTTSTINQTAGNLIIDDLMAKERNNVMATTGAVLFPLITDVAGQVDSFKVPHMSGIPSATPAFSADAGYLAYDSVGKDLYVWDGVAWDNLNISETANNLDNTYTSGEILNTSEIVYISAANTVMKARSNVDSTRDGIGCVVDGVATASPVQIRSNGIATGFVGLVAGSRYYLSAATAGAVTSVPPTGSGNSLVSIGFAKNSTSMALQIHFVGKRA